MKPRLKLWVWLSLSLILLPASMQAQAQCCPIADRTAVVEQPTSNLIATSAAAPLTDYGQSFVTPSTGSTLVEGINIRFQSVVRGGTLSVELYEGSITDPIGTPVATASINFPNGFRSISGRDICFQFASPLVLTPGADYFFLIPFLPGSEYGVRFHNNDASLSNGNRFVVLNNTTINGREGDIHFSLFRCSSTNTPPTALCQDLTVDANANCQGEAMAAAFDGGSSDPDGDMLFFSVNPSGPYALGTTNVTLTVSDGQETATCMATITVTDNIDPVINCPADVMINTGGATTTILASYPLIDDLLDATGNHGPATLSGGNPPPPPSAGNPLCLNGVNRFSGDPNETQLFRTATLPSFDPSDFSLRADFKLEEFASNSFGYPILVDQSGFRRIGIYANDQGFLGIRIDNASPVYSTTQVNLDEWNTVVLVFKNNDAELFLNGFSIQLIPGAGPLSTGGGSYSFGTTSSSPGWTLHGCIRNVQIGDGVLAVGNVCSADVTFDVGATDNCPGVMVNLSHDSGSTFPLGTTTVTATATDAAGNTTECSFDVTVIDVEDPEITCPADLTIDCGDLSCVEVGVVYAVHNGGVIGGDPLPQLGTLDPATGAFSLIGDLRDKATGELINVVSSLAISEEGILYGVTNSFGGFNPRALYKINACTGLASLVGTYDSGNPSGIKGIAFDDAQRLIGLEWEGNGQDVFEFNLGTGAATKIFDDALDPLWYGAAEKDPNSNLIYIASWTDRLIRTLDPQTGVVNVVVNTPVVAGATVGDIFFGQDGYLYLTTGRRAPGPALYRIDVPNETSTKVADFTFPNGRGIPAVTSTFDIIPQTGVATATDNCGDPTIAFSDSVVAACGKTETIYRTWTATDPSGNAASCQQIITVIDTTAPVAPMAPMDVTVACASDVPIPVDLTALDCCDGAITVSPSIQITPGSCSNDFIEVRTWTFTDSCGNASSVSQTITVLDTLAPVAPTPPADVRVQCAADVPPPVNLTAQDNCDGAITVSPSAVITPGECANQFTEVRTWTFTDDCGNSSSVSQTIMVNDTIRPTFDRPRPPRNVEASCGQIPPVPVVTATDNCDGTVPVTFEQTDNGGAGFEYDPLIITRTWTAMDECGNTRRRRQTITVIDCPDPCNIEGITVGSTTTRMMAGPVCNGDGTYDVEICIQWKGNPMPDFIEVEINGTGGFIQIPIDGPQDYPEKCFTLENLPANGRNVMIFARIGREGCTYRARDFFRAPDRCDPPPTECDITGANVQIEPTCDNGTVSTCVMIEGALLPQDASNARAFVGGQPVEITQYTLVTGGAVVCFQGLRADGGSKDFFFQAEPGCSITKRGFLRMPRSCDGDPGDDDDDDCDITGMRNPVVNCDGNGTYSLTFDVTYNDMLNGQLAVEVGHGANKTWSYHAVTGSPQTITVTGLPAVGGYANVFIKSNDARGCTWYERSWYRAPSDCGRARDGEFTTNLDQVRVYPNPSAGQFFLLIEQDKTEMIEVAVSNAVGQVVKTIKVESNREEVLDLEGMPEGIYTLRIMQSDQPVFKQIQVQR